MFAKRAQDELSYDGTWRVGDERIVAGKDARLRLHFRPSDVYLVLGGKGDVEVRVDGRPTKTVRVDGYRLYTLRDVRRSTSRRAARAALLARRAGVRVHVRIGRLAVRPSSRATASSPSLALLALAEEARQLGGERVARRQLALVLELVGAALELLDVGGRVLVGGDRLAHLLDVGLALRPPARSCRSGRRSASASRSQSAFAAGGDAVIET